MTGRVWGVLAEWLRRAAWAPVTVFLLHALVSLGFDGYTRFPPLDLPMHFFGGVVIAYFFSCGFDLLPAGAIASDWRPLLRIVLVSAWTATAAVFWEFAEFTSDALFDTGSQKSLEDTLLDMALGIAGGLCYLLVSRNPQREPAGR